MMSDFWLGYFFGRGRGDGDSIPPGVAILFFVFLGFIGLLYLFQGLFEAIADLTRSHPIVSLLIVGLVAGTLAGVVLAAGLSAAAPVVGPALGLTLPTFPPGAALALPLGAMVGDIAGSFLKRRIGRERGAAVPGLDQLDFVAGALALAFVASRAWAVGTFTPAVLAAVVVLTPVLHLGTNGIGYVLGLKNEPW
jgi:CDP-2,3-bis-(O-geranylgeranyl)-sn-glycerol synthase